MLFYIFIFIECISGKPDFSKCKFMDSINSLSNDKLQLTPTTIDKDHFCNIHTFFDVTFESDPQSKIKITKISDHLFCDCFIGTLTLSEEIVSIGNASFFDCRINEIKFPPKSKLTEIGSYAFYRTQITSELQLPCSILSIGNFSFAFSKLSSSITLPNSVASIGDSAFSHCSSLTSITLSKNVASIGDGVFIECRDLKAITVNSENPYFKSVEGVLFNKNGSKLICYPSNKTERLYRVPDYVKTICDSAFFFCNSLAAITLQNGVTSIGNSAFSWCRSLLSITISDSVISIGDSAFSNCLSLSSIILPESVSSIGNSAFSYCSLLRSIALPNIVTSIGDSAFYFCESLTSISLSNSITSIGKYAF